MDPSKSGNLTVVPGEASSIPLMSDMRDYFTTDEGPELDKNLRVAVYTTDW